MRGDILQQSVGQQGKGGSVNDSEKKLKVLLELGQIIGLDLQIDDMLLQIALKANETIRADRLSLFLYDKTTDMLTTTVAFGMEKRKIRISSSEGIAGYCFQTGEVVNISDAYKDPRFSSNIDELTGYRTESLLCTPLYGRSGKRIGIVELINKKDGRLFTADDESFLEMFNNHATVFIEIAQLQSDRLEALNRSKNELELLNRAKGKAIDHLSHELKTPVAVIEGAIRLLKGNIKKHALPIKDDHIVMIEKNLHRILDIQKEAEKILRVSEMAGQEPLHELLERLKYLFTSIGNIPQEVFACLDALDGWIVRTECRWDTVGDPISLAPCINSAIEEAKRLSKHRDVTVLLEIQNEPVVVINTEVLKDVISSLLKNAVENTPDQGTILVKIDKREGEASIEVIDSGTGITDENKKYILDGLFHTQDTNLYSSKKPYDFNAGGKGLELMLIRLYGRRYDFRLSFVSTRCYRLPDDTDVCPGKVSECPHCKAPSDCASSGGSSFSIVFHHHIA